MVPEEDDARDLARLRAGDDRALAGVYRRHSALVHGIARRITGDEQLARDVTQEVFCHLWERAHLVDLERGSLRAWLGVVAHHRAVDVVRSTQRRTVRDQRVSGSGPTAQESHEGGVLDDVAQDWRAKRIRVLLGLLPADQREALELAYFSGYTYRQVAALLGIPEGTAKSRLRLALGHLRALLERDDRAAWT